MPSQMQNEYLYPLYLEFNREFRMAHPEVANQYIPVSFEVFNFTLNMWEDTLEKREIDATTKRWRGGWKTIPEELRSNVHLWKYCRSIRLGETVVF